jgi:hypothetical protein
MNHSFTHEAKSARSMTIPLASRGGEALGCVSMVKRWFTYETLTLTTG